jgi:hypothetical protein
MIGKIVKWDNKRGKVIGESGKRWKIESGGKTFFVPKDIIGKKKMKIAILISGRLTSYDKHYQNIMDNLVQGNDVDFYAGISTEPINPKLLDGFLKMYKPVAWKYSDKPLLDIEWDKVKANKEMTPIIKNPMMLWRNRDNVRSLFMKSKVNYDWVISTRVDVFYKEKLNYNDLEADKINIPRLADFGGYQDKIAIAKKPLMLEYLDLYDNMKSYLIDKKRAVNPEPLLKYHIDKGKNIPVHRMSLKHGIFPKVSSKDKAKVAETGQK